MKLDLVHDMQMAYRKLLKCMSRPGLIENIENASEKIDMDFDFYNPTLVVTLMLLDAEVSFEVISYKEEQITEFINQLTYAKSSTVNNADFIFIMSDAEPEDAKQAIINSKVGTLIDPHKSATIIVEVDEISNEMDLVLKGPGIDEVNYIKISGQDIWLEEREKKNIEYPLGVDLIFIDKQSNVVCIPRTTQIYKS